MNTQTLIFQSEALKTIHVVGLKREYRDLSNYDKDRLLQAAIGELDFDVLDEAVTAEWTCHELKAAITQAVSLAMPQILGDYMLAGLKAYLTPDVESRYNHIRWILISEGVNDEDMV